MPAVSKTTEAFLKAYDELSDALFRHCYFRLYDRERAKDTMQECFAKTWEYLAEGKEIKNLKAFLYRVANNLVIDHSRKKKEASLEALQEQGYEPAGDGLTKIEAAVDTRLALDTLARLDEKHRQALLMRYVDGLGPKEISEITGESQSAISVRIHRGLKQLRAAAENI